MSDGVIVEADGAPEGAPQLSAEDLAMVEKGRTGITDPAPASAAPVAERPDHIPEKFWKDGAVDTEAMARSYAELEKRQGAAPTAEPAPAAADEKGKIEKAAEAAETPAAAPYLEAAAAEFAADGKFSDDTVANLEKVGIPKEIQEVYLAGVQALAAQNLTAIHGYVGGEANYQQMATWAASALNDADLDAFNTALDNPQLRETAVRGLYARYAQARPSEGAFVAAVGAGAGAGDVFGSRDELVAAQKDPRYTSDPKYRDEVIAKLSRSQQGGFRVNAQRMFDTGVFSNGR